MNVIIDIDMGWFFGLDFGVPGVKSMILCMLDKYYEVELYPLPLDLLFLFIVCVQGHMMCMRGKHATACVWRSENSFVESVLSFCLYMGSRHQIQVSRHWTWVSRLFLTHWAISLAPSSWIFLVRILVYIPGWYQIFILLLLLLSAEIRDMY